MKKESTYNNLIDLCIKTDEDPELAGDVEEIFRTVLMDYFFEKETYESKKFENFMRAFKLPDFIKEGNSLLNVDVDKLASFINGTTINDSLAGKIMLSADYLKSFYPQHPPMFNKMPQSVQEELIKKIKGKNQYMLSAFEKMHTDREADKNRKVITLVALILKNIHRKKGLPFNKLTKSSEEIIRSIFEDSDQVFMAKQSQLTLLHDETKVKELIKTFFIIKKFNDITEISELFWAELERYKKRAQRL